MKARLERGPTSDEGTFGRFVLESGKSWVSLELPWRDNERGRSCIKADVEHAQLVESAHFGRKVYKLEDSNGRAELEIHIANFAGDARKGWKSQLHGCIALGLAVGKLDTGEGFDQAAVLQSGKALDELIAAAGGEDLEIEIVWQPGAEPKEEA